MNLHCTKYLLCYDIADSKRLRRVHRMVRDWGVPIQFSVFELELNPNQLAQLLGQLSKLIETNEDKLMFYRLSPHQKKIYLGAAGTDDLVWV